MVDADLRRTKSNPDPYGAGIPITARHRDEPGTKFFIGWFGPRGLASIVFAVMVFDADVLGKETLVLTAACTVLLSIITHGVTANPLIAVLGRTRVSSG